MRFESCFVGINSDLITLFSFRCFFTLVPGVISQREGGEVTFLLSVICEQLKNVNNCCYDRCCGKSHIVLLRFLKFNAGNRVKLFQDSILKCLKVTNLPFFFK